MQNRDTTRSLRGVDILLIEPCASEDSELTTNVPYGSAALCIAETKDFTLLRTRNVVLDIICIAKENDVKILVRVATPCISGCPWKHVNYAKGFETGDPVIFAKLMKHASKICRFARFCGGHYVREWLERLDLSSNSRVKALTSGQGYFMHVSACAVGWEALQKKQIVTIRKRWGLWTSDPAVA